jgi:MFS family permease
MIGRAITAAHWGLVADVYGGKPVIAIGLISVIVFHTLFGLSTNFWMALSSRFFLGFFNGMLGPAKAYASELTNARHQAQGMVVVRISTLLQTHHFTTAAILSNYAQQQELMVYGLLWTCEYELGSWPHPWSCYRRLSFSARSEIPKSVCCGIPLRTVRSDNC